MGDFIDILETIADVCLIGLGILYGIFIITKGGGAFRLVTRNWHDSFWSVGFC